jgi:hypothetical protein
MGKDKEVNKSNLAKKIFFILTIALFLLIGLVMASADEVQKEKIENLEKEEISDDASQELLKEYYGNLLGYVGTKKFNSMATKDNIAVINVTVNGRDRRILTKLHTGTIMSGQDLTNAKLIMTENLVVVGNISLRGALFSEIGDGFGSRRLFGLGSTTLRYVDEGFSRLVNGEANVSINPVLRDLIKGYNVFLSAEGLTRGLYVAEKTDSYFVVKSLNPASNVGFSWMLRGVRDEYDDKLRSQYGKEKGISITATINYENSTTSIKITGLDNILALVNETTNETLESENNNLTNQTNNNSNNQNNNLSIQLITGNLVDEFGLETDLGKILGEKTQLPTITDENTNVDDNLIVNNETNQNNVSIDNNSISNDTIVPVEEISVLEFTLYNVEENFIIDQISDVTGLSLVQVKKLINFVYLEPEGFEDEIVDLQPSLDFVEKVDGSVIIRLG